MISTHCQVVFNDVSFLYETSKAVLLNSLSVGFGQGWTGVIGANGSGKTTFLKLATGLLLPSSGNVSSFGISVYCRQRTDEPPVRLPDFLNENSKKTVRLMKLLSIEYSWQKRWQRLSHGERKRAQIACALFQQPEILAIDEPTNHLDGLSRKWISNALRDFRGIGLLVSHDRELLDRLCTRCIFIEPPDTFLFTGNYTESRRQKTIIEEARIRRHKSLKQQMKKLTREEAERRRQASMADDRTSKKKISPKDHDAKSRLNLVKLSGKDGSAGKQLNQIGGRVTQLQREIDKSNVRKRYKTGITMAGEKSRRDFIVHLKKGYIKLSKHKKLCFDDVYVQPDDKIGLTGANGTGKSCIVDHIVRHLLIDKNKVFYLPQEIHLETALRKIEAVKRLPGDVLGNILTAVTRLGSNPKRILETVRPSPGEIRKILIAEGLAGTPEMIVMDEPTNHLDLPSVECLEEALSGCDAALLLVSHDHRFLEKLTQKRWDIKPETAIRQGNRQSIMNLNESVF